MQPLRNLMPASNANSPSASPATIGAIPPKWIDALLMRFSTIWPRKWADSISGIDYRLLADEWAQGLAGLTGADIKRGLESVRAELPWPPSIAEFRTACHGGANAEQRAYAARASESAPMLANKTRAETLQAGAEAATKAREVVRGQGVTRSLRDALAGLWTPEREESFQHNCTMVWADYPTPSWLHEAWQEREAKAA